MRRAFFIAAFVIAVLISGAPTAASGTNEIYNFRSNQCLQPVNGSTDQGTAIIQEPCNGGAAQKWVEVSAGSNIFHYVNVLSGLCLDARSAAKNGTPSSSGRATESATRTGNPENIADDIPALFSRVSGTNNYCLDIPGAQQTAGLAMQIYRCNGTEAQEWWVAPSPLKTTITKGNE
jgi:Ricin-type beta-trefoil lectin domain-like